jgi:hypothetical protein
MSAVQILCGAVAQKSLFTRSAAGMACLSRRVEFAFPSETLVCPPAGVKSNCSMVFGEHTHSIGSLRHGALPLGFGVDVSPRCRWMVESSSAHRSVGSETRYPFLALLATRSPRVHMVLVGLPRADVLYPRWCCKVPR